MATTTLKPKTRQLSQWFIWATSLLLLMSFPFSKNLTVIAVWLLCISCITSFVLTRQVRFKPIVVFPLVLFISRLLCFLFDSRVTFKDIELSFTFAAVAIAFLFFQLDKKKISLLLLIVLYAYLGVALWVLIQFVVQIVPQGLLKDAFLYPKHYYPQFLTPPINTHPSFLAITLSFSVPIAYYLRHTIKSINGIVLALVLLCTTLSAYLTGSRIGIIVDIVLVGFCSFFYFRHTSVVNKVLSFMFALVILGVVGLSHLDIDSDPIRQTLRNKGLEVIQQHPWAGTGLNSMHRHLQEINEATGMAVLNHFHNQFIDESVQFGISGGLFLFALFVYILVMAIKYKDFWLFTFPIVYFPFMLVETPLRSVLGVTPLLFWLLFVFYTQEARKS